MVLTKVMNDLKPSKTTKNNQHENLIDSSKVFVLGFQKHVGIRFRIRDADLKQKTRPVTRTQKSEAIIKYIPRNFRQ